METERTENPRDCKHGSLARSCEICERDAEIAELVRQISELKAELAATKPKWQVGLPPCNGWYMVSESPFAKIAFRQMVEWDREVCDRYKQVIRWAGPIEPPEGE